jgi:hypothetical protein
MQQTPVSVDCPKSYFIEGPMYGHWLLGDMKAGGLR